ncbi:MAG TPA: hypothetical protein VFK31_09655 [Rhodanobacteraceae bacterium]|nr:hypothetical protein [Rhodanobacteraceae bacterium]
MADTISPVMICSDALLMLGSKPIASFSEASDPSNLDRARLCANLYPMVKLAILRSHPWNCATKRVQLSPDATPPAFGYTYRFALPGDWLRTLSVGDGVQLDYRSEGRFLLCNERVFPLTYLANIPETEWDTLLIQAVTLAMSVRLAYPITASTSLEQLRYQELQRTMQEARAVDGQDNPPETLGGLGPLLASRFGARSFGMGE